MASTLVTVLVAICVPFVILGLIGNIGVILCILLTPSLRTRANAIIVSLTFSCLAFILMVVPFTMDSFLHSSWRFAILYCHATAYLSFGFIGITVCNIAVLSLYRYFCVVHPMKLFLRSTPSLVIMVATSWFIPITLQTSLAVFQIAHTEYVIEYARCVVVKTGNPAVYNGVVFGGFLPTLGLTLFSYAGIYLHVWKSARRLKMQAIAGAMRCSQPDVGVNNDAHHIEELPAQRRHHQRYNSSGALVSRHGPTREQQYLTKICVVVFVLFMACYGPIIILSAIYAQDNFPADAYKICTVIYWLGSCLHPLVYAILQPQMQRSFLRFVQCCRRLWLARVTSVSVDLAGWRETLVWHPFRLTWLADEKPLCDIRCSWSDWLTKNLRITKLKITRWLWNMKFCFIGKVKEGSISIHHCKYYL